MNLNINNPKFYILVEKCIIYQIEFKKEDV